MEMLQNMYSTIDSDTPWWPEISIFRDFLRTLASAGEVEQIRLWMNRVAETRKQDYNSMIECMAAMIGALSIVGKQKLQQNPSSYAFAADASEPDLPELEQAEQWFDNLITLVDTVAPPIPYYPHITDHANARLRLFSYCPHSLIYAMSQRSCLRLAADCVDEDTHILDTMQTLRFIDHPDFQIVHQHQIEPITFVFPLHSYYVIEIIQQMVQLSTQQSEQLRKRILGM